MKTIACKVKDETYNDLHEIAENSDVTISEWVRGMIEDEFKRLEIERKGFEDIEQNKPVKGTLTRVPDNEI
ncbi:MAG: hypothetical protein YK1309IOTA_1020005 [Marine Group I thaumarchaeote]|nr:MAG: hypothetical protein YK1309IOTA_1020005 [Marine Group I thaumarchaeote]